MAKSPASDSCWNMSNTALLIVRMWKEPAACLQLWWCMIELNAQWLIQSIKFAQLIDYKMTSKNIEIIFQKSTKTKRNIFEAIILLICRFRVQDFRRVHSSVLVDKPGFGMGWCSVFPEVPEVLAYCRGSNKFDVRFWWTNLGFRFRCVQSSTCQVWSGSKFASTLILMLIFQQKIAHYA